MRTRKPLIKVNVIDKERSTSQKPHAVVPYETGIIPGQSATPATRDETADAVPSSPCRKCTEPVHYAIPATRDETAGAIPSSPRREVYLTRISHRLANSNYDVIISTSK